ncbi:hypothetical protein NIES2135_53470 [Leptolyngbya boryana NIES-2135]|jgi:hypothetical protein|uniref:Uncharacterized protein n=1 Tax=Leptolyngbya boryana NIES-2135 TaxID=1973484 RepID=A0A1Z4JP35_LEPBY|nr:MULTISPECIES: hypothetical protein [Leptolyngbya]BAY58474.1 hypothetical protein NIES2135_53470 [Leptolyngbya boryana NIES-2135]MBD2370948.1 hypothetical protein [Leptolyngbya sp. FACHB-161]MBD2377462.1 hypothetical protein [Leptolyngbya sp. FACHB-238]MBD2401870.1 hypothetical protein [Leptolyngbya sp. FACHB-239]MBD2408388.1 hypothetical protein [Leptolyngbya sp. FACHB-402]
MTTKQQQLLDLQISIAREECQKQLRELVKDAVVEPVENGFVVHNYRDRKKGKPKDAWIPSAQTLISQDFWVCHPFPENLYQFVGEWLKEN